MSAASAGDQVFVDRPFEPTVEGEVLYVTGDEYTILPANDDHLIEATPDEILLGGDGYAIRPIRKD